MGEEIADDAVSAGDRDRFSARCRAGVEALRELVERPGFGAGPPSAGIELEIGLVGPDAAPAPRNADVARASGDERLELELDRFNLELNSAPVPLAGSPFTALESQIADALGRVAEAGAAHSARPVAIGILPALGREHLGPAAMSDSARYRALDAGLRRLHGGPFRVRIEGTERLEETFGDVTLEGAATGLHVHLRAEPRDYADTFNAARMAIVPALAASGNSPLLLGRVLWEETRVALFGQAVDDRDPLRADRQPSRASFGHGWIADPVEPFAESVALHAPILPVVDEEGGDPLESVRAGGTPELRELRLHHGTVWRWVRAAVALGDDPHLRVEARALPAGPTPLDMAANAAFLCGLTLALAPEAARLATALPFDLARRSFYAAARHGLAAELAWPSPRAPSPRARGAADLVADLLPRAREGLAAAGVDAGESERLLDVVAVRVATGATGAAWQRAALARLEARVGRRAALPALTEEYMARCASGEPVHRWSLPGA